MVWRIHSRGLQGLALLGLIGLGGSTAAAIAATIPSDASTAPLHAATQYESDTSANSPPASVQADVRGATNGASNSQGASASSESHTSVTVNGQDIPVPDNRSLHTTVKTNDGTVKVDITSSSDTGTHSGNASNEQRVRIKSRSSQNVRIHSAH